MTLAKVEISATAQDLENLSLIVFQDGQPEGENGFMATLAKALPLTYQHPAPLDGVDFFLSVWAIAKKEPGMVVQFNSGKHKDWDFICSIFPRNNRWSVAVYEQLSPSKSYFRWYGFVWDSYDPDKAKNVSLSVMTNFERQEDACALCGEQCRLGVPWTVYNHGSTDQPVCEYCLEIYDHNLHRTLYRAHWPYEQERENFEDFDDMPF